jgi:tetratricopeptide (TPR) repeat protein
MVKHVISLLFVLSVSAQAQIHDPRAIEADPATANSAIAPVLGGLGDHSHKVTASDESQAFFNQGLRLTYGFNHSEALRAFKEAVRLDPNNAMAYWGWALVLGPNLNLPMVPDVVPQAYEAIQKAVALKDQVSTAEQGYINALATRYSANPEADRAGLDQAYAKAMANLAAAAPEDSDANTLYAAALMNLSPWDYWYPDGAAKPDTPIILGSLERAMELDPKHPGALHYYIHAVEARHPQLGEPKADQLVDLMPGAGHMVHMPSHIFMRVGRYADSYQANYLASLADERYIAACNAQGLYALGYYPHNVHFLAWSAMYQGRSKATLQAARRVAEKVPGGLDSNTWAGFETFLGQPLYAMVRFGLWDALDAEPAPPEAARYLNGVWHYAQGMAAVHRGRVRNAQRSLKSLKRLRKSLLDEEYYIGFASVPVLLEIAGEVLEGEIAARRGRHEDAIGKLERAVRLQDTLTYNEPPDWYFPVRHILGAVLMEAGLPAEAEVVYWEDLKNHPDNGYALFGLRQALEAQGKTDLAEMISGKFEVAFNQADVLLTSSRF